MKLATVKPIKNPNRFDIELAQAVISDYPHWSLRIGKTIDLMVTFEDGETVPGEFSFGYCSKCKTFVFQDGKWFGDEPIKCDECGATFKETI